jgi:hypothetical protein
MAISTLYSYTINGIEFSDPLSGAIESSEILEKLFNDGSIDKNTRVYNNAQLGFTGSAYAYICARMQNVCFKFEISITNFEGMTINGTFFSYMVNIDMTRKIASTQIKDTSWSSILRNRTDLSIYMGTDVTISCEPLEPLEKFSVPMFDVDGVVTTNPDFRYGFDALEVLNFLVKYLTDNVMSVECQFLEDNPVAIFNAQALQPNSAFIPAERLSNSQIYLKASFNEILTPLRKQYGLDMDIDGNTIYLIPNGEASIDTSIIDLGELPLDATMKVDSARLYSSVKVGSTAESFDFTDEENEPFIAFPETYSNGFNEVDLNNCNCELDKDNNLDLSYDIITDTNVIHKALYTEDYLTEGIVFVEAYWYNENFLYPKKFYSSSTGKYYYNEGLRVTNIIERWNDIIINCLKVVSPFDEIYRSVCTETYIPLGSECENNYNLFLDGDGNYKGFLYWINPNQTSPPPANPDNIDTFNGWINTPGLGEHEQALDGGYSGYVIPFNAWYAFTATAFFATSIPRNSLDVNYSIVVYEDSTLTNEIYRKTVFKSYGSVASVSDYFAITSDAIFLDGGNCVLVQTEIEVDSDTPQIGQMVWEGNEFYYDTGKLSCITLEESDTLQPFLYTFNMPLCLEDYNLIKGNRRYALTVEGVNMWVSKIERGLDRTMNFILSSNDVICKNICITCDYIVEGIDLGEEVCNYIIPNATLDGNWIEYIFAEKYENNLNDGDGNPSGWEYSGPPIIVFQTTNDYPFDNTPSDEELNLASTYSGIVTTLTGESLAQLLYDKWLAIPTINKSRLVLNGRSLTVYISNITDVANLIITRANAQYLPVNSEDFFEYRTVSTDLTVVKDNYNIDNFDLQVYIIETHPSLSLFVNINGNYVDISSEIVDGVWQRLNSTDIITDYYFYNNDLEEIVLTGLVDSLCEEGNAKTFEVNINGEWEDETENVNEEGVWELNNTTDIVTDWRTKDENGNIILTGIVQKTCN